MQKPPLLTKLALFIATGGGVGFIKKAPGTFGTAVGACLVLMTTHLSHEQSLVFWSALFAISVWATKVAIEVLKKPDPSAVVIDEILGIYIASFGFVENWLTFVSAFFLFRFFDIFKLPPVRNIDRWSKNHTNSWMQSVGVIADDLVAAAQAWLCLSALMHFNIL